ncbi:hypothetical protein [Halorubellus sp. PRR65]|uniref:hypothetical protein n=1 Tax=Halorubellus sp. PRR65 TaxID=3098148 RepID=UPI002B25697E|nr:hypothetical protein [Halorubellus sp. PRR65]
MSLLPVDTDALKDICRDVAMSNYGFLYVTDKKGELQSGYESADTGTLNASDLSDSDLRDALREASSDEFTDLERIRDGVYYVDTFSVGSSDAVTNELTSTFSHNVVITSETLRSRFDLAMDDVEFFVSELTERDLVQRITAGERDYYTIGPRLKEHAENVGFDSQLERKAANGKISHSDLEDIISIAATKDIIRYLEQEGYVIDLDGEYLVESALDEFGGHAAHKIEDRVEERFEESKYLLPTAEFPGVVRSEIEDQFDVLSYAHRVQDDIVDETKDALETRLGLETEDSMVVMRDEFDAYVEQEARRILGDVKAEADVLPASPPEFEEAAEEHVEVVQVSNTAAVNRHVRESIEDEFANVVAEEEFGGVDA